ncbi:hypothetical protein A6R68_19524, partial [Neotoma lepida]
QHHDAISSPHFSPHTPSARIYYRTNNRYQLKGQLLQGDVSLTIENATESDSGLYCCRETLNSHKTHNYSKETFNNHKTYNYSKETSNYHKTHNYYKETLNNQKTHNYSKETLNNHQIHNYSTETNNYHKTHNYSQETLNYHKTHNYYKETLNNHKTHNYSTETSNYHKAHNYFKETLINHQIHNYYKTHNYFNNTHKCSKINQNLYLYSSSTTKHTDSKTSHRHSDIFTWPLEYRKHIPEVVPTPTTLKIPTKGLYIGISVSVVLLILTSILMIIRLGKSEVNAMMHLQVFISGLILLLPAPVESFPEVHGVVGHPVTLPCTYPVSRGISPMCWGQGACFSDKCEDVIILTNGYYVYYERNNRYHLKGQLLQGNVSLTIENATESDSGLYCCRVETKGWNGVQRLTTSLQVQPGIDPTQNPPVAMTKGFYIGISITLLLLLLVITMVITSHGVFRVTAFQEEDEGAAKTSAKFGPEDPETSVKMSFFLVIKLHGMKPFNALTFQRANDKIITLELVAKHHGSLVNTNLEVQKFTVNSDHIIFKLPDVFQYKPKTRMS